jgi:hypothetical protein
MHPHVLITRKPPPLNWERRFFWQSYTERELCKAIRLTCGRELGHKRNSFKWRCLRKRLIAHYQSMYGEVPNIFIKKRLPSIMEIASTAEYRKWVRL